jgi:hypothetical protein
LRISQWDKAAGQGSPVELRAVALAALQCLVAIA